MYRSEVTEGWIRDCQARSRTIADEVRKRKRVEREIELLRAEVEAWRERALTAEGKRARRVA